MKSIDFSAERFKRVKEVFGKWWQGKNTRPLAGGIVLEKTPKGREPKIGVPCQQNISLKVPPEQYLDAIEYEFSKYSFYGDAFPYYNMDCFGPGIVAGFLGSKVDNSSGLVWFSAEPKDIEKLDFKFDEDNAWYRYVIDFCKKSAERFEGKIVFSMPDLGGVLDVLAVFLPEEAFLLSFYDSPDEVKRLTGQITKLWKLYYDNIAKALGSAGFGYSDWSHAYSEKPCYILQSDSSIMISPEMFEEFSLPHLKQQTDYLDNTMFHLDGEGMVKFLDMILGIEKLKAMQWVPAPPYKRADEYPEIFTRYGASGKRIMMGQQDLSMVAGVAKQAGNANLIFNQSRPRPEAEKEHVLKWLKEYKIEL